MIIIQIEERGPKGKAQTAVVLGVGGVRRAPSQPFTAMFVGLTLALCQGQTDRQTDRQRGESGRDGTHPRPLPHPDCRAIPGRDACAIPPLGRPWQRTRVCSSATGPKQKRCHRIVSHRIPHVMPCALSACFFSLMPDHHPSYYHRLLTTYYLSANHESQLAL